MTLILHVIFAAILSYAFAEESMKISPDGASHVVPKGNSFVLTCELEGTTDMNLIRDFRWLDPRNQTINEEYLKQNNRFSMPPSSVPNQLFLILQNMNDVHAGTYTCVANYDLKTLSKSINIKTVVPITFVDAPEHQFARKNEKNFKLKCHVEARPSPLVTWLRSGTRLVNGEKYIYESDGLIIRNVEDSDDGSYACQVMVSTTGNFQSRSINLEVISDPVFLPDLSKEINVTEGEKAVIPCSATGKPSPSFSWIKKSNKKNLTTVISYDGKLILDKVAKEDDDIFTCVASNSANTKQFDIKVNVRSKPQVVEVVNSTIAAGSPGQLICYVYGNPTPNVTIRKLGFPHQNYETNDVRSSMKTTFDPKGRRNTVEAILKWNHVEKGDDGLYECVASNGIGDTISNLHLIVEYQPFFEISAMVSKVVTWNQLTANLTCVVQAIPNATITWYQGTSNTSLDKVGKSYFRVSPVITGRSILQITPIERTVYGPYRCMAANQHGQVFYPITLEEGFLPENVRNVHANTTTASSVTFEILDPATSGNLPIKGYHCQYIFESQGWDRAQSINWPYGGPYIVTGLAPLTKYSFRFSAQNEVGLSGWSGPIEVQTPQISAPSQPIFTIRPSNGEKFVRSSFANRIELYWTIPTSNGADIQNYAVKFCPTTEEVINRLDLEKEPLEHDCETRVIPYTPSLSAYPLVDVKSNTYYKVILGAQNSVGPSENAVQYFKTAESVDEKEEEMPGEKLNSAVIIYIVVALLIGLLVIVDIFCFFVGKTGVIYTVCGGCCLRKKNNDDKLGSLYSWRFPLPYCGNVNGECSSHSGNSTHSEVEKVPLSEMTFVFESRDLINNGLKNKVDIEEQSPMITDGTKRDTAVEYDVKKGVSKTGFVGKDSAV